MKIFILVVLASYCVSMIAAQNDLLTLLMLTSGSNNRNDVGRGRGAAFSGNTGRPALSASNTAAISRYATGQGGRRGSSLRGGIPPWLLFGGGGDTFMDMTMMNMCMQNPTMCMAMGGNLFGM